jgi:1-acyl-sn-glycerol-3-phosphate acyltransferase
MSDFDAALRRRSEDLAGALLRAFWGIKVSGLESVPRSGPLLVACNHASLADPPLLGVAIAPARRPCFLAKKELFSISALGSFFRGVGVIPLDRGSADHAAMRAAFEVLEAGGALAIFPEGTRTKPGERRAPKLGVSFLSARSRAPVIPARVVGTARFPRERPLEVRFGSPLPPPAEGREAASSHARAVMDAIYSL